jgi:RecB family exonuclease
VLALAEPLVSLRPLVLLTPSQAAAVELPRRVASTGRALAGIYAMKPLDLAGALAEPVLLGRGLSPWTNGHDALVAARLLAETDNAGLRFPEGTPRAPVASALARTLATLRRAGIPAGRVAGLASAPGATPDDASRLSALSRLYDGYRDLVVGRMADPVTILAAAREGLTRARWLEGAEVLIADDLELEPDEVEFIGALAARFMVRVLRRALPPSLRLQSFRGRLAAHGVREADWAETPLAAAAPPEPPASLVRLREWLFEPPSGPALLGGAGTDAPPHDAVELVTAPGEAAEARAIVRRLLGEAARGVPFEEMGVVLPRPETYAPLFTDLLARVGVPHRLHPSLPLRFGRAARSLLLLFRCRGLERPAVMEFLTFAPVPFEVLLGPDVAARPAIWDHTSREAGIVSGYSRFLLGLRAWAGAEREAAETERDTDRRERRLRNATDADALLRLVEILNLTLDSLAGEAPWSEWVERLRIVVEQWLAPESDRERVLEVIADLGGLGSIATRAPWSEVEQVIEARFEWERLPLDSVEGGAIHVGAFDAMAGLPFRVVAIPGLVEGGYPGVFRPDPFLLDSEREALRLPEGGSLSASEGSVVEARSAPPVRGAVSRKPSQLALFSSPSPASDPAAAEPSPVSSSPPAPGALPTSQDRLVEARRLFHRAVSQATERLILSYPRVDARSGRERLPSLFFAAAAATLAGRPVAGAELDQLVVEDDPLELPLENAVDAGERDRFRVRRDDAAATAIAAGSPFFQKSRLASQARWSGRLTRYDGMVLDEGGELAEKLDPLLARHPVSASRLAIYARCGFQYLLQHVLRLQPAPEPEERRRIDPLERGDLFHRVAERYLRERRDRGELPVTEDAPRRERLREMAEEALQGLVAGSPPRFTMLWEREKRRFHETMQTWLTNEAAGATKAAPAHFELSFGLGMAPDAAEPHDPDPLEIDLGDGRSLRVSGRIDRIDRRLEGGLVLRDYKTGRAPKDDGGLFRGGRQLQIPFYVLAAEKLFPGEAVVDAFLDYVDGGRQVAFRPEHVTGPAFRGLLRDLIGLVARGVFVQEPSACDFCDFTVVCGPKGLLQRRQGVKIRDASLQAYLRLRDIG